MRVKNYQEELVLNTINLVLQDRSDVDPDNLLIHDVAAYTLNRIPPRYIMSERGFTRLASEYWVDDGAEGGLTNLVELVFLVNRAIDVVTNRRKRDNGNGHAKASAGSPETPEIQEAVKYWHNFPHLMGKVLNSRTREPVYGVRITLYLDGELAESAEPGWVNPYYTNYGTKGFYSFWPKPLPSESETRTFDVEVLFEHPDHEVERMRQTLETRGDLQLHNYIKVDNIFHLGTCELEAKGDPKGREPAPSA
jgi:competence protein ComFB